MTPDDPRHGTSAGAGAHYKTGQKPCEPCKEARNTYYRRYNKNRNLGYVNRIPFGHGQLWHRINNHMNSGYSYARLAVALGGVVREAHLFNIHVAGPDRLIHVNTWRKINAAIDAVPIPPTRIGTLRRLQALHRLGHTITSIMAETNVGPEIGKRALRGEHLTFKTPTMWSIAAAYDRLSMTIPASSKGSTRARKRGERMGWLPPLAWINIDDPNEVPKGWAYKESRERGSRPEILHDLVHAGGNINDACNTLHMSRKALEKWCARHDLSPLYRTLTARERHSGTQYAGEVA